MENPENPTPLSFEDDAYGLHARHLIQEFHAKLKASLPGGGVPFPIPMTTSRIHTSAAIDPTEPVGILGAGPGGLYAALILEELGIPYRILEAQARERLGGRLFTYKFPDDTGAPYNYYDVGAMRFPKITSMSRLFHLFDYPPLNTDGIALKDKLKKYYFRDEDGNAFYSYNGVTLRQNEIPSQDPFKADQVIKDVSDPHPYIAAGTKAITDDVIAPFATRLLQDLDRRETDGWEYMKQFDHYSTRAYMSLEYSPTKSLGLPDKPLPTDVVNWLETFDKSSGWYDRAFSETVLEAIAFGWRPEPNPPPTEWFCIDGGAHEIAESMAKYIFRRHPDQDIIAFNNRVTSIALRPNHSGVDVVTNDTDVHHFSHVISTIPLPVLRTIDLSKAELSPMQSNALRSLDYGPSVKVGIQFKTAWWTTGTDLNGRTLNIVGGQTYTDRPLRTVVYPSFGDVQHGKTTTLIASYCWTEDATRLGAMVDKNDQVLKALVLRELADIHNVTVKFLNDQFIDMKAWDWSNDEYTMGAFAFFGPGKFGNLYTSLTDPAAKGYLHFAGEAISVRHAWVEGALDSAWRAVAEMFAFPAFDRYRVDFFGTWGVNPEWIKKRHGFLPDTPGEVPEPSRDLVLEHLALTHPDLFSSQ